MRTPSWTSRALALRVGVGMLALTLPGGAFGQPEAESPLTGGGADEQHPAAESWPRPQYDPGTGRVPLQDLRALSERDADPTAVGFAAAAVVQPRLAEGLTLGPPTATRVLIGAPSEPEAGAIPGDAAPPEPRRPQRLDAEPPAGALVAPDPEQAAEVERDAAGAPTAPTTARAGHAEKWFIHYPLNYSGVPLAKFSDVVTMVAGDGEVLYVRRRNMPQSVDATEPTVPPEEAAEVAREHAAQAFQQDADLEVVGLGLEIWVGPDQRGRLAWSVGVETESLAAPEGRLYWISAVEPAEVLYFESAIVHQHGGTITGMLWEQSPFEGTVGQPLPNLEVTRTGDDSRVLTNDTGRYSFPGTGNATIRAGLVGPPARVENRAGSDLMRTQSGDHNGAIDLDFNANGDEELAQVTAFYWADATRRFVSSILLGPEMERVPTRVNIDADCNAFWHRIERSINFFRASDPSSPGVRCPNTAYVDIVAHEYGHGVDQMKGGIQDGGYSEGFGDALALLLTRQSCVGRDLFGSGTCLRDATDVNMWPPAPNEGVHSRGRRYGQFVWALVQELAGSRPEDEAYDTAARLVLAAAAANPADIPDAVHLMFIADDDDGDLSNGTPHFAELAAAADSRNLPRPPDPTVVPPAGERVGYAWANDPTAARYTPSATYAHNSAGGPVEIQRLGPGRYAVSFAGLGGDGAAGGHVQVTAYGTGSEVCKVGWWSSTGADLVAEVRCHDAAGNPADTRYTVYTLGPKASPGAVAVVGR